MLARTTLKELCLLLESKDVRQSPQVCNFHDLIHETCVSGNCMAMKLQQPLHSAASRVFGLPAIALLMACLGTFAPEKASAQDPEFTQFYSNPVYLNPAFAGAARCPRFVMNYRNQWPAMSGNYVTSAAAYDQHIPSISGGLGFIVMNDRAGRGTLSTTESVASTAISRRSAANSRSKPVSKPLISKRPRLESVDLWGHD